MAAVAGRAAKRLKRGERVVDQHVRAVDGCETIAPAAPAEKARGDELVAVMDGAGHGDEQVARPTSRLSKVTSVTSNGALAMPPVAAAISSEVQSALTLRTPARPKRRRMAALGRR